MLISFTQAPIFSDAQLFKGKNSEISVSTHGPPLKPQTASRPSPSTVNLIHFFCYAWHTLYCRDIFPFTIPNLIPPPPHCQVHSPSQEFTHAISSLRVPFSLQPSKFCHLPVPSLILPLPHVWLYQPTLISFFAFLWIPCPYQFWPFILCSSWIFCSWNSPFGPKISPFASFLFWLFHSPFPPYVHVSLDLHFPTPLNSAWPMK